MDPKVYYKTQESSYARLHLGAPLTDEILDEYERKRNQVPEKTTEQTTAKRNNRAARRKSKQVVHEITEALGLLGL